MSVKINIPVYLQPFTNDLEVVEVSGSTVGKCLNHLVTRFPAVREKLFNKTGKLHAYVAIYVNGEDAYPEELAKPVKDGDQLDILYVIGGG